MFEDDDMLTADPTGAVAKFRMLGVSSVRLAVRWRDIAPNSLGKTAPRHFNASDPTAYPTRNWATLDAIVRALNQGGIGLNLDILGPAPRWASGPGAPKGNTNYNWNPNPSMYRQFVQALGTRYSGNFDPQRKQQVAGDPNALPRVKFWSVWNEPDYGPSLAPQGVLGHLTVENSPRMYRNLVDAAWTGLHRTGHGSDTVVWGELAPRGMNSWGVFSGMKPLVFLRAMYCVDSHYRQLRGAAAAIRGCPTNTAGSRQFRALNPGLFQASGVSDHPYMRWYQPNREIPSDPDYSSLGEMGNLERALDRLQLVYGSSKRLAIWNTEFGYLTSPPKNDNQIEPGGRRYPWVSQTTAAYYLNWAEYISWRDPRVQSFFQYLMKDPLPALKSNDWGGFASGLLSYNGTPKPGYYAWRMPLYMPVTSTRKGQLLEVWGCARPAVYAARDTGQTQSVQIQLKPSGQPAFSTVQTVSLPRSGCYFDVRVPFASSGTVRLGWTFPSADPGLTYSDPIASGTAYSREVAISVH
ncbi:MAG TPA: hypothetical protein VGY32_09185 [Solirubrobacteraceae bacterium]|nr:hypothetical protein [Solirubrobacteraceae bacterium]